MGKKLFINHREVELKELTPHFSDTVDIALFSAGNSDRCPCTGSCRTLRGDTVEHFRRDASHEKGLVMRMVADNVRKGAILSAV